MILQYLDNSPLSHPFSSVISSLLTRVVCTSVCHVAMEEVSVKEDPSDLTLVHPALDPTSALRKWLCTQLSRIERKSYCMQPASFPTHPNKEHVIEALYTEKQEYHTPNHIHPYLGTFKYCYYVVHDNQSSYVWILFSAWLVQLSLIYENRCYWLVLNNTER